MAKTTLTNEEWEKLERWFSNSITAQANFMIDGYKVNIRQVIDHPKIQILCGVNGQIRGEWFTQPCEIQTRFYPFSMVNKYRPSYQKDMVKIFGRKTKARFPDIKDKIRRPRLTFKTIAEVRKVFEANNNSITLLTD